MGVVAQAEVLHRSAEALATGQVRGTQADLEQAAVAE